MKVLASADLHGNRDVYRWLGSAVRANRVDAVILAGDLLGCPDGFENADDAQQHEASELAILFGTWSVPVFYVMGNDDSVELNSHSAGVQSIHCRRVELGPFSLVGYQYSLPFMGGVFEKPETAIAEELEALAPLVNANTVFVSHSPVFGVLDAGVGDACIGSASLGAFLHTLRWRAHIHGHSHAGFGRSGNHFNVASGGRERAMIVDLVTLEHEVIAAEGEDTARRLI